MAIVSRRRLVRLLIVAACVLGLVCTIYSLGPGQVLDVALRADPRWLALSVIPLAGRFLVWGFKWKRMLARREPVPFGQGMQILAAGAFVNLTTPTAKLAGAVVRAVLLQRRRGWGLAECYGWSMADQATNVLGHLLLYALLALGVAATVPLGGMRMAFAVTGALVLIVVVLATVSRGRFWRGIQRTEVGARFARLVPARLRRGDAASVADRLRQAFEPLLHRGGLGAFVGDIALAATAFACLCLANAMVLRSLGVEAPLLVVSTAVVLGYVAGVAVGAWGGVGVTEAALTGLYVQFGVPPDQAAAGALLHRGVYYLMVLGWGGVALLREGRGHSPFPKELGSVPPQPPNYSETSSSTPL